MSAQTKPPSVGRQQLPGQSIVSSRLCQETAATMAARDDSAFCPYHRARGAPLGSVEWEFKAVRVETLREEHLCHQSCPLYQKSTTATKKRKIVDEDLALKNLEPEIVPVILKIKRRKTKEEDLKMKSDDDNEMDNDDENGNEKASELPAINDDVKMEKVLKTKDKDEKDEGVNDDENHYDVRKDEKNKDDLS